MTKNNIQFVCSNCDAQYSKWAGRCLECGKWGTLEKSQISNDKFQINSKIQNSNYEPLKTTRLDEIKSSNTLRTKSGIGELDRVLGGGFVPGSLILLGGEPGIGKSTLALQLAQAVANTLYISGEESAEQIKLRADRLKINTSLLRFVSATNVESVIATINNCHPEHSEGSLKTKTERDSSTPLRSAQNDNGRPALVIIDSIQTLYSDEAEGAPGNVNQIRACATKLMAIAKTTGTTIILIGQVTKGGEVAGPKTLEHLVDTVLYLEGDRFHGFRILRAVKNRFGSTDEVGIFEMRELGLIEVANPSQAFLSGRAENVPGTAVTCLMEGTRPILIEIQALVTKTNFGYPQRRASGFDLNRLQVLIGILTKRAGLPLDSYDVYLNVVGGMEADEPAADLAVVLAVASAIQNKTLPSGLAAFGEVGLAGEVRGVPQTKKRLEEIKKLGFSYAVTPSLSDENKITGLKLAPVKNVIEVVEKIIK
ncbi:MAG: DNA repair protein RadA [Candidatus Magasanikbacteria bacterium]